MIKKKKKKKNQTGEETFKTIQIQKAEAGFCKDFMQNL